MAEILSALLHLAMYQYGYSIISTIALKITCGSYLRILTCLFSEKINFSVIEYDYKSTIISYELQVHT